MAPPHREQGVRTTMSAMFTMSDRQKTFVIKRRLPIERAWYALGPLALPGEGGGGRGGGGGGGGGQVPSAARKCRRVDGPPGPMGAKNRRPVKLSRVP